MHMIKSGIRCIEDAEGCDCVVSDFSSFTLVIGLGPFADISIHSTPEVTRCYQL